MMCDVPTTSTVHRELSIIHRACTSTRMNLLISPHTLMCSKGEKYPEIRYLQNAFHEMYRGDLYPVTAYLATVEVVGRG